MKRKEFIFVSFYYGDDYYYRRAEELKLNLDKINVPYEIEELKVEGDLDWIDITKEKISYIYSKLISSNAKRV